MKSIHTTTIILIVMIMLTASCRKGSMWAVKGEGESISQVRDIKNFSEIELAVNAQIQYTQDSVYFVEVNAQKNILSILEMEVQGNALHIDMKRNVSTYRRMIIKIHSPNLTKIEISGSGSLIGQNGLKATNLYINISGLAYIGFTNATLQSLNTQISGSGEININAGTCKVQTNTVSGSGTLNVENLISNSVTCNISGSGAVICHVLDALNVSISGSGHVKYHGKPTVSKQISGSGSLTALD